MTWLMACSLIGGLGLFMLGMQLMTGGMKLAAGRTLRDILERSTRTPWRGILSGAAITSLVQSSGAVTVATIGFVNAGIMRLEEAIMVIYGSNIGTTMTGWLVVLAGFHFDVKEFALPAVGIGMAVKLISGSERYSALGEALAGFGVFFIGIDVMQTVFAGIGQGLDLSSMAGHGFRSLAVFLVIGFFLTVLMQSSSAAIAISLTAASGGVLNLHDAAAMVIGANIGTTSTAAFAVIGATPNARRVAASHVIFNLLTGLVAILLLPLLFKVLVPLRSALGLADKPASLLALFHTTFNLLGVALMWPLTGSLVTFLQGRFRNVEEDEARPVYLDNNIVDTPVLAMHALSKELGRMSGIARRMAKGVMSSETGPGEHLRRDQAVLMRLETALADFCSRMQRGNLPASLDDVLPNALRVSGYCLRIAELCLAVATIQREEEAPIPDELAERIALFRQTVVRFLEFVDVSDRDYTSAAGETRLAALVEEYKALKAALLRAGTRAELTVPHLVRVLEQMSDIRRIAEQAEKAARYLSGLTAVAPEAPPESEGSREKGLQSAG
jgi:phosphate:Na+ symporter